MQQTLLRDRSAAADGSAIAWLDARYALKVALVYQDATTLLWARQVRDRMAEEAGQGHIHCTEWQVSNLKERKTFSEGVAALAQADAIAKDMMAEMLLAEIRKFMGLTQEELAGALGVTQPSLSKLENQDDMQVSTLRRLIEALGGELEMIAHLPKGDIRIMQFKEAS